jgi:thymidylate synthase
MWPIYYKDKLQVGTITSNVGIVTLWTPVQTIATKLDPSTYCLIGQLYSKRGINFIIRNILANPIIDTIVICGSNLSGSAEALINLIDHGIDSDHTVIGVEKAPIDTEIDNESIELFRKNVRYINLVGEFKADVIAKRLASIQTTGIEPWTTPKTFADPEPITADKFPSEKTSFVIRAGYIKDAWPQVLRHIMKFGSKKGMIKVGEVKELVNVVTVIEDENPYKPDIPKWFSFDIDDLKLYYKGFFSKDADSEDYNYGQRIFSHPLGIPNETYNSSNNSEKAQKFRDITADGDTLFSGITLNQIEEVYLKLKRYKYDRGAVISVWNPWVDNVAEGWMADTNAIKSGNVPCMTQLQFAYREHKLQLTAYFRSNDMYDAWPRNAFALRKLQFDLAAKLDMKPGYLTINSSLAQIYENNFESANQILEKSKNITNCRQDQRGNVIIEVVGNEIVMKHMDTSGNEVLQEFRIDGTLPKSAHKASDVLLTNLVFAEIPHAMDVARELMKAELAIKNKWKYTQDRDIEF